MSDSEEEEVPPKPLPWVLRQYGVANYVVDHRLSIEEDDVYIKQWLPFGNDTDIANRLSKSTFAHSVKSYPRKSPSKPKSQIEIVDQSAPFRTVGTHELDSINNRLTQPTLATAVRSAKTEQQAVSLSEHFSEKWQKRVSNPRGDDRKRKEHEDDSSINTKANSERSCSVASSTRSDRKSSTRSDRKNSQASTMSSIKRKIAVSKNGEENTTSMASRQNSHTSANESVRKNSVASDVKSSNHVPSRKNSGMSVSLSIKKNSTMSDDGDEKSSQKSFSSDKRKQTFEVNEEGEKESTRSNGESEEKESLCGSLKSHMSQNEDPSVGPDEGAYTKEIYQEMNEK